MMMLGSSGSMPASRRSISVSAAEASLASAARPPSSMTTVAVGATLSRCAALAQTTRRAPELLRIQRHSSAELDG